MAVPWGRRRRRRGMLWGRVPDSCFRPGGAALCVACRHKNVANAKGSKANHTEINNPWFARAERAEGVPQVTPGVRNRCCWEKAASLLPCTGPGRLPFFQGMKRRARGRGGGGTGDVLGLSPTAGSHKEERNVWFGPKLPPAAVPLTGTTCTPSGASGTAFAPWLPSGSASAGGSGAGQLQVGLLRAPRQTVCRICK